MSGRLASFRGPSTPTSSPVRSQPIPSSKNARSPPPSSLTPHSPKQVTESTYHRKLRQLLQELQKIAGTWDDLVLHDGLRAVKGLVDARTELDNELSLIPAGEYPRTRIVSPKLERMDQKILDLEAVIVKLKKQFGRMTSIVESTEMLLYDACKTKGFSWTKVSPLWTTWPLEKFVTELPALLSPYHRELWDHKQMVEELRPHNTSFEVSRALIARWVAQEWLEENGWQARWEDLCEAEVEGWE